MLYEHQKHPHGPRIQDIACASTQNLDFGMTQSDSLRLLDRTLGGSRFANLERALGRGAVFLLYHSGSDAL